jgi:hypothetical protein
MLKVLGKEVKLQLNGVHQFVFRADDKVYINVFNESTDTQVRDMTRKLL